jgi:hypothetical protein
MLHSSATHGNKGTCVFFYTLNINIQYLNAWVQPRHFSCVEEFIGSGLGVLLNPDPVQVFITNLPLKNTKQLSVSVQEEKLSFLRTVCRQVANTLNRKDPDSLLVRLGARQVSIRSPDWTAQLAPLKGLRSSPSR